MAKFLVDIPGVAFSPEAAPAAVLDHPSMMSLEEKSLLYLLARDLYTGEGSIVDAGLFMGASTVAFASGLRENRHARRQQASKPIQSYDIALWAQSMHKRLDEPAFMDLFADWKPKTGESFEPLLRRLISGT